MTERCPWYIAGPLLGLLIVAFRAILNKPLGALGGYIDISENGLSPRRLGVRGFIVLDFVMGGAACALATGSFSAAFAYAAVGPVAALSPAAALAVLLGAGIAMGAGARTAGGCTSGHGMTGMSLGSPASVVACVTFFATAVALAHAVSALFGGVR